MLGISGDHRKCDPSRLCQDPQSGKPPLRSPFLPLVALVLLELGIPLSQAPPKLFSIFLCLLYLRIEECGRTFEYLDLEIFGRGFWEEVSRSVEERTMRSLITRRFLVRHDRCSESRRSR